MLIISRLLVPALALIASGIVGTGLAETARAAEPAYFTLAVGDLTLDDKASDDDWPVTLGSANRHGDHTWCSTACGEAYWYQAEQNRWSNFSPER